MKAGWTEVALGEVATVDRQVVEPDKIIAGTPYVGLENVLSGGGLRDVAPVAEGQIASGKFMFDSGHVLFGKLRPNLAKSARPDFAGVCSTDILPVRPGGTLDRDYLAHFIALPGTVALATRRAAGANLPRLSPSQLKLLRLPLPPLDEQRRIARILDAILSLRARRHRVLDVLNGLQVSLLEGWLEERPSQCDEVNVSDLASVVTKGTTPTSVGYAYSEAGVRFLRAQDLLGGTVAARPDSVFIDSETDEALKRSRIASGDVLISIAGTVGRVAIVPEGAEPMNCNQAVAIIRCLDTVRPRFLQAALGLPGVHRQITGASVTGTISNLSLAAVRSLVVRLPSLSEQVAFETELEGVANYEERATGHLVHLDALFASLQHRAFTGAL